MLLSTLLRPLLPLLPPPLLLLLLAGVLLLSLLVSPTAPASLLVGL
jgi:hypothetical protein